MFEGWLQRWIIPFAQFLAHEHTDKENAGIAVLMLASSLLEPLGGVLPRTTKANNSEAEFLRGFQRAFPEIPGSANPEKVAVHVCDFIRDGLFHEAFIKAGIALRGQEQPIVEENGVIYIDPRPFLDSVANATTDVCAEIRSAEKDSPIRRSFDEYWSRKQHEQTTKAQAVLNAEVVYPPALGTNTLAPMRNSIRE